MAEVDLDSSRNQSSFLTEKIKKNIAKSFFVWWLPSILDKEKRKTVGREIIWFSNSVVAGVLLGGRIPVLLVPPVLCRIFSISLTNITKCVATGSVVSLTQPHHQLCTHLVYYVYVYSFFSPGDVYNKPPGGRTPTNITANGECISLFCQINSN